MKKFMAVILALVMIFAMSSVAFAVDTVTSTETGKNSGSENVTVTVNTREAATTYHVLIQWTDLTFTYEVTSNLWNEKTHTYDATGVWNDSTGSITIENHSNANIMYSAAYVATADVDQDGITITPTVTSENAGTLVSADADAYRSGVEGLSSGYEKGPQGTITVTASGNPTTSKTTATIGTIVVTIDPVT